MSRRNRYEVQINDDGRWMVIRLFIHDYHYILLRWNRRGIVCGDSWSGFSSLQESYKYTLFSEYYPRKPLDALCKIDDMVAFRNKLVRKKACEVLLMISDYLPEPILMWLIRQVL